MIALTELISSLKQSEIRALKAQYSLRERNEQDLRGKLLDLILNNRNITDEIAAHQIYNSKPNSSFSHLKSRLWDDACGVLALQSSFSMTDSFPARAQVSQLVNVARVLKGRELYAQSFELAREALDLSIKHALVPELMLLKDFVSSSFPEFWVRERTKVLTLLADSVKKEADRFRALTIAEMLADGKGDARHVAELEALYRSNSCEQIRSIVHRSMINIHLQSNNKEKLIDECIQLYSLALETKSDNEQRKNNAIAFCDITKAALHVKSFDSAIVFGKAGLEYVDSDIVLELEYHQNLMIAYLNTCQFDEAESMLGSLEKLFSKSKQLEFKKLQFYYLKAWYLFMKKEFKTCLRMISQLPSIPKEREDWHAGFYIIELLSLLKTGTYFQIDYRNDAYRKYQIRHDLKRIYILDVVYRTFKTFIDNDYEFTPASNYLNTVSEKEIEKTDSSALSVVNILNVLRDSFSGTN